MWIVNIAQTRSVVRYAPLGNGLRVSSETEKKKKKQRKKGTEGKTDTASITLSPPDLEPNPFDLLV